MAENVIPRPTEAAAAPRILIYKPVKQKTVAYRSKASTILGSIQILAGVLMAVLTGISYVWLPDDSWFLALSISCMIGCGFIFFVLSGGFAIGAAKRRTRCLIITHMVMAIFASCMAICIFALALTQIGLVAFDLGYYRSDKRFYYDQLYADWYDDYKAIYSKNGIITIVIYAFLTVLSLLEFVAAVWSSSLACRATCCTKSDVTVYVQAEAGQSHIITGDGQIMMSAPTIGQPQMMQAGPVPEKQAREGTQAEATAPPPYE